MGKIKNFVTGLFSKKDDKDEEVLQLQPASVPDRELEEIENRYETPDYQAFLNDMGYIDRNETRSADAPEQEMDPDAVLEEGSYVEDADEASPEVNPDNIAEEPVSIDDTCESAEDTFSSEMAMDPGCCDASEYAACCEAAEDNTCCEKPEERTTQDIEEEQPLCEVDQDFIDEGVAELGVNDVWPEEEK